MRAPKLDKLFRQLLSQKPKILAYFTDFKTGQQV